MPQAPRDLSSFQGLIELVKALRGPEGCPWDRAQNHQTLAPYSLEEVHELLEAIENGSDEELKEELGDVLFQVALHAQLAEERNKFTISEVLQTLNSKMVRRHPHVFSNTEVKDIEEVWANWEKIKAAEKSQKKDKSDSPFSSIPSSLPALQRAYKVGVKTEKLKFDWPDFSGVLAKWEEENEELRAVLPLGSAIQSLPEATEKVSLSDTQKRKIQHELGDVLFTVAQMARHLDLEPEQCLREANRRFEKRFETMISLTHQSQLIWEEMSNSQKEMFWEKAKDILKDEENSEK